MAKRVTVQANVRCIDCAKEQPVTREFPAWDGTPVFCTCEHLTHYRNRRWAQPCAYHIPKTLTNDYRTTS